MFIFPCVGEITCAEMFCHVGKDSAMAEMSASFGTSLIIA
jgi:hypothetical protein